MTRAGLRWLAQMLGILAGGITLFVLAWRANHGLAHAAGLLTLWAWWDHVVVRWMERRR